jgi:hypothetical protein
MDKLKQLALVGSKTKSQTTKPDTPIFSDVILNNILINYYKLNKEYPLKDTEGLTPIYSRNSAPMEVAAFTSNSGAITNVAIKLQDYIKKTRDDCPFKVAFLFSDSDESKGRNHFFENYKIEKIAKEGDVTLKIRDIDSFYKEYGFKSKRDKRLSADEKMDIRRAYDQMTVSDITSLPHKIKAIMFDYYWSICTREITSRYSTINSHLGDLTYKDVDGKRVLIGYYPVRNAIFLGHNELYSTTHLVDEFTDNGELLIRSRPLKINLSEDAGSIGIKLPKGKEVDYLSNPDNLEMIDRLEDYYEAKMRHHCDSQILPLTVLLVSEGRFAKDASGNMYFNGHKYDGALKINNL